MVLGNYTLTRVMRQLNGALWIKLNMDGYLIVLDICNLGVREVESRKVGIQLESYTFTRVTRQLDGVLLGQKTIFKEISLKNVWFVWF